MPQQKFPCPVEGHARRAPDDLQQVLGGVDSFANILVEGDEKENAVRGCGLHLADQFFEGEIIQKLDLHVPGKFRHPRADLVCDGHAGQALVADDHQPLLARVKTHGHGDIFQDVEFLQDAGHVIAHGHGLRSHVVHAAKDDRHIGKKLGAMLIYKIIGMIVGDNDQIEISVTKFIFVIIKKDT
jgi:hypothetical protein